MSENTPTNSGFSLPMPNSPTQTSSAQIQPAGPTFNFGMPSTGGSTSSRDMLIGGALLLVLIVAFFLAKNWYANGLVAKRVQPSSANAAGWWLFIFLTLLSVGVILAVVSGSVLMTPFIVGPLSLGALVSLVLMIISSRR